MTNNTILSYIFIFTLLSILPLLESASCDDQIQETNTQEKPKTLQLKLVAIASILLAGALGITIPIYGNKTSTFNPENNIFFLIKAFAAGVILGTGFVHILPDAFESLSNPCLERNPWGEFPFAGFVAMVSAVFSMMIESLATGYYKRCHVDKEASNGDEEKQGKQVVDVHTHASHGHAHGSDHLSSLFRHRIVSQVLEVGIVVHSVVIGISLGASKTTNVIKSLVAALTFHQFFEGMGLGGCISQANFRRGAIGVMVLFFSVTTPAGIGIGIGISQTYNENTSTALVVQGVLSSASAGILIYMALVDLLAEDFMNPKLQTNLRLQLAAYFSLLLGMSCMSVLAKWA